MLYLCKASVEMFDFTRQKFVDTMECIITVGEVYRLAASGQIIFT